MPFSVSSSFTTFLSNISITEDHVATARTRTSKIVELLRNNFEILEAFPTGSLLRGTAQKGIADVDVIAVLHYSKHIKENTPRTLLETVREALSQYRVQMAKKNGQSVTLYFESWPNVDIVPASRVSDKGTFLYYNIPDAVRGVWIQTDPKKHDAAMARLSVQCRERVRMMKAWNGAHSEYLQSFHIEVIELFAPDPVNDWCTDIYKYFEVALNRINGAMSHPNGATNNVDGYLSATDRSEAKKRLEAARVDSLMAWRYAQNGRANDAIGIYRRIFGSKFPAYG